MAVPTVSTISPDSAHTGGRTLIEIIGTNFRLPTISTSGQTDGQELKSVEVLFGTELSPQVDVTSDSRLFAQTPLRVPGKTSVTVRNIDAAGVPIPGESVTVADAFDFILPVLTGEKENRSDLLRFIRTLISLFRSQVIDEVAVNTHTDWDESGNTSVNVQHLAKLPALVLLGPKLSESRFYTDNEQDEVDDGDEFIRTESPSVMDLGFDFVGVSNNFSETLNLMSAVVAFFRTNRTVLFPLDPDDPSKGNAEYEIEFEEDGEPDMSPRASNSNLHPFSGSFLVRGFRIEGWHGVGSGQINGVPNNGIIHRGATTDDQGVVLDPTEQTAPISGSVRSTGLTVNNVPTPTAKADQPLVVRAILSERSF